MSEQNTRNICIQKLNELIDDLDTCQKIEEGIYQHIVDDICHAQNLPVNWYNSYFKRAYLNKCITLYLNLDENSYIKNTSLKKRILNKELDPYRLAFLTPQELFPENWTDIVAKKEAEDEFLYAHKLESFTDEYTCGRCKEKKCSYFLAQTRSGDESTTVFVTCLNCDNRWKFS